MGEDFKVLIVYHAFKKKYLSIKSIKPKGIVHGFTRIGCCKSNLSL